MSSDDYDTFTKRRDSGVKTTVHGSPGEHIILKRQFPNGSGCNFSFTGEEIEWFTGVLSELEGEHD